MEDFTSNDANMGMQVNDGKPRLIHSNQEPQSQSIGFPLSGNNTFCLLILKNYFKNLWQSIRQLSFEKIALKALF